MNDVVRLKEFIGEFIESCCRSFDDAPGRRFYREQHEHLSVLV